MRKFDTKVQHLKYKVLREVARAGMERHVCAETCLDIPKKIVPGKHADHALLCLQGARDTCRTCKDRNGRRQDEP